jgi:hypothetical protein
MLISMMFHSLLSLNQLVLDRILNQLPFQQPLINV